MITSSRKPAKNRRQGGTCIVCGTPMFVLNGRMGGIRHDECSLKRTVPIERHRDRDEYGQTDVPQYLAFFLKAKARYCGHCGKELIQTMIGAEKYEDCFMGDIMHPYQPYSNNSGKRQYVRHFKCPDSKGWLFNPHDDFTTGEIETL